MMASSISFNSIRGNEGQQKNFEQDACYLGGQPMRDSHSGLTITEGNADQLIAARAGKPLFQNRGIFRNPVSILEGGYSRISTQLHAFTGKVIRNYVNPVLKGQTKEYMTVAPLPEMKKILIDAIGRDCLMIEDEIPRNLIHYGGIGLLDTPMLIPIENLASLHSYTNSRK